MRHLLATTLLCLALAACAALPHRVNVTIGNESLAVERDCPAP